jgi:hypothetical protein
MLEIKSCVVQEQKHGCGVACLATILGNKYSDIAKFFKTDLNEEGLDGQILMDFLSALGFDLITKAAVYYGNGYNTITSRILKPYADIHIVAGYQFIESTKVIDGKSDGHWMILTKEGKLLCPSDGKESKADWLVFDLSIGIFYPPNFDFTTLERQQNALDNSNNSTSSSNS